MKFVDLKTGSIYNGDIPYIHWFEDNQSTNLIYFKKLCIVSEDETLEVKLHSSIFKLIDISGINKIADVTINDFSYKDIEKLRVQNGEYTSIGYPYNLDSNHVYLHMVYIESSSSIEGEFLDDLYINNQKFTVGASFHPEYEPHKINLGNFGIEIPEDINRSLYPTNLHEEAIDYITLNRKRKELLMNYWDIFALKGSYKSLYDSLKWFEYGDLVKIQELWEKDPSKFSQQEISQMLTDNFNSYMSSYSKTTYIGLYAALNQLYIEDGKIQYEKKINLIDNVTINGEIIGSLTHAVLDEAIDGDEDANNRIFQIGFGDVEINGEENVTDHIDPSDWLRVTYNEYNGILGEEVPELVKTATRWSAEEMALKMYLLGNFYETYFMPIHLDLIHSTIERTVFTNTFKILQNNGIGRHDFYGGFNSFKCSVKDNSKYYLENVSCQVNNDTKLGVQWEEQSEYSDIRPIGIDPIINNVGDDNELKTFMTQYYDGIGKIVDFDCELRVDNGDFIKKANIVITCLRDNSEYYRAGSFKLLCSPEDKENGICKPSFKLLFEEHGDYHIALSFETAGNKIYTRNINISILDNSHRSLKVYRVVRNEVGKNYDLKPSDYIFSSYRDLESNIRTFTLASNIQNKTGVGFQRLLIFNREGITDEKINSIIYVITGILNHFDEIRRNDYYLYLISKTFDENNTNINFITNYFNELVRDEYVYVPQNHHLEELCGDSLSDYNVNVGDTIMIIPDIKYLKSIEKSQWVIENVSTKNMVDPIEIKYPNRPYATGKDRILDKGFYDVKFRYLLGDDIQEISLNSAFQVI